MPTFTTPTRTTLHYLDWGSPDSLTVVLSHGWPLSSADWENQMFFLTNHGYRTVALDRRGHGRSASQPWDSPNTMDAYADDLAALLEYLDLRNITLVGHSTGGGEVARYMGRHGTARVAKAVLLSAVTPLMLRTEANTQGTPKEVFNGFREAMQRDRAQFFLDVPSGPFFGYNRPGSKPSQGLIWSWWAQGMRCDFRAAYECIAAFSETDLSDDLKKVDVPVLVIHGDDDQVVPIKASAHEAVRLLPRSRLKVYPGGGHALHWTAAEEVGRDLLEFLRE